MITLNAVVLVLWAGGIQQEAEPAGTIEALDREVAGFPAERQAEYRLFRAKCASCHTIHRAISSGASDWDRQVRKMARKQGSGISTADAGKIVTFLDYLAAQRRGEKEPPVRKKLESLVSEAGFSGAFLGSMNVLKTDERAERSLPEEGAVGEFVLGAGVSLSKRVSVSLSACYGCHQFELDQAYGEYQFTDGLRLRAGRFPAPLGAFHQRYLPSNRESPSKPVPYAMGLMPHSREFNQGVVPAPLSETGFALGARAWPGEDAQIDFEVYAVRGLKGTSVDFDYVASREAEDNNGEPAVGARATFLWGSLQLGVSAMGGSYDEEGELDYRIGGADLRLRLGELTLRAEVLARVTEYQGGPGPGLPDDDYRKEGYTVQLDGPLPILEGLRFFLMADGLAVRDIYLSATGPTPVPTPTTTDDRNRIFRSAVGLEYAADRGILLKGSAEWWDFSDFDDAWVFHLGAVYLF